MKTVTGRATKTRNEAIDELIDRFRQQKEIQEYKIADVAAGACVSVSRQFADFCLQHRLTAACITSETPAEFGYTDRTTEGCPVHTIALVRDMGRWFGIDWTASQYGYEEFPLVIGVNMEFHKLNAED